MRSEKERADERASETAGAVIAAARGHRAEKFLRDEFWLFDLEPALAKMQAEAAAQKGWRPGAVKSIDETAMSNAYFSAAEETVGEVLRKINLMILAGKEAEEYLKKTEEKTK